MRIEYSNDFWFDPDEEGSRVFQIFPDVFGDSRGNFTEIFKEDSDICPEWMASAGWIKQVNRSESVSNVFRGMHAQKGKSCQSKLVEAVTGKIIDIIFDARPQSGTFGKCMCFELSSELKNRLFVPKGFLHGFYVYPSDVKISIFQYFIGGATYDKSSEFSVNPRSVLNILDEKSGYKFNDNSIIDELKNGNLTLSNKDLAGIQLSDFLKTVKYEFETENKIWYK